MVQWHWLEVNSKHRKSSEKNSRFDLNFTSPFVNVTGAAITRFTMPNTIYNLRKSNSIIQLMAYNWVTGDGTPEAQKFYSHFDVDLSDSLGRLTREDLVGLIHAKVTQKLDFLKPAGTTAATMAIELKDDYVAFGQITNTDVALNNLKRISPAHDFTKKINSLWHDMGFTDDQIADISLAKELQPDNVGATLSQDFQAIFPAKTNQMVLNLHSKILTSDSFTTTLHTPNHPGITRADKMVAIPLATANMDWIDFAPSNLNWHSVQEKTLSKVDLEVLDENGEAFETNELPSWSATLMFKIDDGQTSVQQDMQFARLNAEAYIARHSV